MLVFEERVFGMVGVCFVIGVEGGGGRFLARLAENVKAVRV